MKGSALEFYVTADNEENMYFQSEIMGVSYKCF